jgi:hypothetical protein
VLSYPRPSRPTGLFPLHFNSYAFSVTLFHPFLLCVTQLQSFCNLTVLTNSKFHTFSFIFLSLLSFRSIFLKKFRFCTFQNFVIIVDSLYWNCVA